MPTSAKHIVLIGFKHVGKSRLGQVIAAKLNKKFIDLDREIEILYTKQHKLHYNCRQIMHKHGETFFRELETQALQQVIKQPVAVIALGGGAPLNAANAALLKSQLVVYVTAEPRLVFGRIMTKGLPAFFVEGEDPWLTFNRIWQQREPLYQALADITIDNSGEFTNTVQQLYLKLRDH